MPKVWAMNWRAFFAVWVILMTVAMITAVVSMIIPLLLQTFSPAMTLIVMGGCVGVICSIWVGLTIKKP